MNAFELKNGIFYVDDMPLETLAQEFGTPLYVYSATQIEDNFNAYMRAFSSALPKGKFTICYAAKANSNLAVLKVLQLLGSGTDIVSGGELQRALKVGIPPEKIVFSGVGKTKEEIRQALDAGIFQLNVESPSELQMISEIAENSGKKAKVAIRVNPDIDAKTHAKITTGKSENKFGIDIALAPALFAKAKTLPGIQPVGVAVHIGSQITDLTPFEETFKKVAELVWVLRKDGHNIATVDVGGGVGIAYKDETPVNLTYYAALIRNIIAPLNVHIIAEPGRSIVGNAGVLLSRVLHIKEGKTKKFAIIDAAMNDLLRPSLYGAYHKIIPLTELEHAKKMQKEPYDIVGPVCETGDTFLMDEMLPPLLQDDFVAIMTAGAYGAAMASNYNTRPLASEVLVHGKEYSLIRHPQTVEYIVDSDIVPRWLE